MERQFINALGGFLSASIAVIWLIASLHDTNNTFKEVYDKYHVYINSIVIIASSVVSLIAYLYTDPTPKHQAPDIVVPDMIFSPNFRIAEKNDATRICDIAKAVFKNEELLFKTKILLDFIERKTFTVAETTRDETAEIKVVGYYAIFPLQMTVYRMLKYQDLPELKLKSDYIVNAEDPSCESLYILDIAQDIGYSLGETLTRNLLGSVGRFCQDNDNIKIVCGWAFGPIGLKLAKSILGMEQIIEVKGYRDTYFCEVSVLKLKASPRLSKWFNKEVKINENKETI